MLPIGKERVGNPHSRNLWLFQVGNQAQQGSAERPQTPPHLPRCSLAASPGQSLIPQPDLLLLIQTEFPPDPIKHLAASGGCPRFHKDVALVFLYRAHTRNPGEKKRKRGPGEEKQSCVHHPKSYPASSLPPCPVDSGMLVLPHHPGTKRDTEKQLLFPSQGRDFSTSTTFLGQRSLVFPQYWSRACGHKESVISGHIQPGKPRHPTESGQNFLRGCKLCF